MLPSMFVSLCYSSDSVEKQSTYDGTLMRRVCEFRDGVSRLAIIQEDLVIRPNTNEVVARGRELYILNKFSVGVDRLFILEWDT